MPPLRFVEENYEREVMDEEDKDETDNEERSATPASQTAQPDVVTAHDSDFVARERLLVSRAQKRIDLSEALDRVSNDLMNIKYLRIDITALESSIWRINMRMGTTDPYEYYGIAPNSD